MAATSRERLRFPGKGPMAVITDLGILTPDPVTKELTLTSVHPGVTVEKVVAATGWTLKVARHARNDDGAANRGTGGAARPAGTHGPRARGTLTKPNAMPMLNAQC